MRGGVIARCHLSRWGRLGRGYSGTDKSTRMVVDFERSRDDGGWRVWGDGGLWRVHISK